MLNVIDLAKRYETRGSEPAGGVFGVTFDVKAGEMFTLLGPSGCGKTTTLRAIAGLEQPDAGALTLDGAVLCDVARGIYVPMYNREIGMVFQSYAIWPHMTVFENAAYPLRVMRRNKPKRGELAARVARVLESVGLAAYQERSATQLSGGQQQRLALARALVRQPKLLLLDEPLSNLDAQLREQMRGELKRIQAESRVTTIYVTHDQAEAMAISDRIAVLDKGRIVQLGTPDEIYDRPRSEFVANFIGRTNVFRGKLKAGVAAGEIGLLLSDLGEIRCHFPERAIAGKSVAFVVRPENVALERLDSGAPDQSHVGTRANVLEGRVAGRVYLGEVAEYTIDLDGDHRLLARTHPGSDLASGDRVRVELPADHTVAICD